MRTMIGFSTLFWLLMAVTGAVLSPAEAHEVATRCDGYGCSTIVCNRTGDRCRRFDEDSRERSYRRSWRDDSWRGDDDGYWHYRGGAWRRNCDPDNPTCLGARFDRVEE